MKTCRHTLTAILAASACGVTLPLAALAQSSSGASAPSSSTAAAQQRSERDLRASQLIGRDVVNAQDENLGEIHDVIVDVAAQRVHYVVLAFGGALGLGEKLFAYPISTFSPHRGSNDLVLNVDKERLQNAPGFERNNWPDWGDNRYRAEVERYFRANAVGAVPTGERMMRVSELIGREVSDRNGSDAGEVNDLVVNLGTGRVPYAVIDFDQAWTPDDKLVPLPLSALIFPARKNADIVLNLDRNQINTAFTFDEGEWPELNNADFRRDLQASFQQLQNPARAQQSGAPMSSGAAR